MDERYINTVCMVKLLACRVLTILETDQNIPVELGATCSEFKRTLSSFSESLGDDGYFIGRNPTYLQAKSTFDRFKNIIGEFFEIADSIETEDNIKINKSFKEYIKNALQKIGRFLFGEKFNSFFHSEADGSDIQDRINLMISPAMFNTAENLAETRREEFSEPTSFDF